VSLSVEKHAHLNKVRPDHRHLSMRGATRSEVLKAMDATEHRFENGDTLPFISSYAYGTREGVGYVRR